MTDPGTHPLQLTDGLVPLREIAPDSASVKSVVPGRRR